MLQHNRTIVAAAPGKIILSGEHAVVYGCPALAMAINKFCQVTLNVSAQPQEQNTIDFDLVDCNWRQTFTLENLLALKSILTEKHLDFSRDYPASVLAPVFVDPAQLAIYATAFFCELFLNGAVHDTVAAPAFAGMHFKVCSTIPISFGMGSSAALIVAIGRAVQEYFGQQIDAKIFLAWSKEIENLQHGKSSGIDLHLAYYGDAVFFDGCGSVATRDRPQIPWCLVNTGAAQSSTGECVMHAKQFFKGSGGLGRDFTSVTLAMDAALQNNDCLAVQQCVRENYRLLKHIGVVPEKVSAFVAELEQFGLAAKISGAGSVRGDGAGALLIFGDICCAEINSLLLKYSYAIIQA